MNKFERDFNLALDKYIEENKLIEKFREFVKEKSELVFEETTNDFIENEWRWTNEK